MIQIYRRKRGGGRDQVVFQSSFRQRSRFGFSFLGWDWIKADEWHTDEETNCHDVQALGAGDTNPFEYWIVTEHSIRVIWRNRIGMTRMNALLTESTFGWCLLLNGQARSERLLLHSHKKRCCSVSRRFSTLGFNKTTCVWIFLILIQFHPNPEIS